MPFETSNAKVEKDTSLELGHIDRLYLCPNHTSRLQPPDTDIISTMIEKFCRPLLLRVFENFDAERSSVFNVNLLTAICRISKDVKSLEVQFVADCFWDRFESDFNLRDVQNSRAVVATQCIEDAAQHTLQYSGTELENLLNPAEKKDIIEIVTTESQVKLIVGDKDVIKNDIRVYDNVKA